MGTELVGYNSLEENTANVLCNWRLSKEWLLLMGSCHWTTGLGLKPVLWLLVTIFEQWSFISLCETTVQELFIFTVNNIEDYLLSTSQIMATVLDTRDSDFRKEVEPLLLQADMLNFEMKIL